MPNIKNNAASQETRRKLISAAGEVFAEEGLHKATIRQITDRAGVNIAAVNYHFRDKNELYLEVLRHAHASIVEQLRIENQKGPAEPRLKAFIAGLLRHFMNPDQPAWHVQLFWRELTQPSPALDQMVNEIGRPLSANLRQVVGELIGHSPMDVETILAANSVVGQCMFYLHQRAVIDRLYPQVSELRNLEVLTDHIAQFSLRALKNWSDQR